MNFRVLFRGFALVIVLNVGYNGMAQSTYRIYFKDKARAEYNPYAYLHPKAIERRILNQIDLCDSSDFPVNQSYITTLSKYCDTIKGLSRWMNMMVVNASETNIQAIRQFSFVSHIEAVENKYISSLCQTKQPISFDTTLTKNQIQLLASQLDRMNVNQLNANHLNGHGITIAIIDAGFKYVDSNPAFNHIRQRNGIVDTYDFVKKQKNINSGMTHGSYVFSCLGGQIGNLQLGLATGAEFLLARTEGNTEKFIEEEYWLMAAEWADKNGADIINSSLGYTYQRYMPENMDGKSTFVSKAAQLAVDKGILVICSAGNEGISTWKKITAPGDAKGVLTVGGISPYTGIHSSFSSFGPSYDKRLKPEVCAYSTTVVSGHNGFSIVEGTSFSAPIVAGFAACIKQRYPNLKNAEVKELICRSADMWPYYDYAHGYGVPQPYFLHKDTLENIPTLSIFEDKFDITLYPIEWDSTLKRTSQIKKIEPRYKFANDTVIDEIGQVKKTKTNPFFTAVPDYLFYHIKNKKGYIDKYYVMDLKDKKNGSLIISKSISEKPFSIEFYYKGYYQELFIKE